MSLLTLYLIACLLTEAITELVVKAEIFLPVRSTLSLGGSFFKKLLSCGYCFSVWAAFGVAFMLDFPPSFTGYLWGDYMVWSLLVHRGSNILHNCIDKWTNKWYSTLHVSSIKED